jgi:hypothetical protein
MRQSRHRGATNHLVLDGEDKSVRRCTEAHVGNRAERHTDSLQQAVEKGVCAVASEVVFRGVQRRVCESQCRVPKGWVKLPANAGVRKAEKRAQEGG